MKKAAYFRCAKPELVIAVIAIMLLSSCASPQKSSIPYEAGTVDVFFCPRDDCLNVLIEFISNYSDVSCAFYDLTHPEVIDSVKDLRVVVDYKEHRGIGIPVKAKGIMHHKFCVSESAVLTGSFNPTGRGGGHRNNIVILDSQYLAKNYLAEFEHLESSTAVKSLHQVVNISGILVENYFCPRDKCERQVMNTLEKAQYSIYFMTYSFTSDPIGELLVQKHHEGITVKGLFEKQQISQWSEYNLLSQSGLDVRIDEKKHLMHHKVFVVDNKTVITGSYNPSKNANENNYENIIILHDRDVAAKFIEEFRLQWN